MSADKKKLIDTFFEQLKATPLANDKSHTIEEAAIWLDMMVCKPKDLIKLLKTIVKHWHEHEDVIKHNNWRIHMPMSLSSVFAASTEADESPYFSSKAFYWIFNVLDKTNALDRLIVDSKDKLLAYASKQQDSFKHMSKSARSRDLYEVFAELVDILNNKKQTLTKKDLSPQA